MNDDDFSIDNVGINWVSYISELFSRIMSSVLAIYIQSLTGIETRLYQNFTFHVHIKIKYVCNI